MCSQYAGCVVFLVNKRQRVKANLDNLFALKKELSCKKLGHISTENESSREGAVQAMLVFQTKNSRV